MTYGHPEYMRWQRKEERRRILNWFKFWGLVLLAVMVAFIALAVWLTVMALYV